jgi:predicted dehydrogenase
MKIGIIGAGAIATTHAEAMLQMDNANLVGVADIDIDAANRLAEIGNAKSYTHYDTMLAECNPEAIIVCTPPNTHPEIVMDLFDKGLHVLCEKPLAVTSQNASNMIAAAKQAGVTFSMAAKFRYTKDVAKAKELIDSGLIGDLLTMENTFAFPVDMSSRWNSIPKISGGGVLMDNGPHSLDLAHFFLGEITEVQAIETGKHQDIPVDDTVTLFARNSGGTTARIELSWGIQLERRGFLNFVGTEGRIVIDWQNSSYFTKKDGDWTNFGSGYDKIESFIAMIGNFVDAIQNSSALFMTAEDGLASVAAVEAAYESLGNQSWTSVHYNSIDKTENQQTLKSA